MAKFSLGTFVSKVLRTVLGNCYPKLNTLYNFCSWKHEILDNVGDAKVFDFYPYEKREILYSWLNTEVIANKPIDFVEFGSWKGESIEKWRNINQNKESRFFGFDSFEGLPEDYDGTEAKYFDVDGLTPKIDDDRVKFIKGWFADTVPGFVKTFEVKNQLVLHMDADLYSSTLFILIILNSFIEKGTIIIFDEFAHIEHEFPAFREYLKVCDRNWKLLCARSDFGKIAIEII